MAKITLKSKNLNKEFLKIMIKERHELIILPAVINANNRLI